MCSMLQIARSDELQFTDHNQNMDGSRSGERLEEKRSAMYRSLDKTIKSSPSSQRITTVDDLRSSPGRHDRVNNMDQTVTKKKRIRGRGNPMVLMNNLAGKVDNEPASKKHKKRSPRKLNQASAKDEKETDRKKRNPFDDLSLPVSSPVKVSILDKFENGGLSESDSDDSDFGAKLIAVEKFSSSPFKSRDDDLKRIDQLIDSQPIPDLKPTTDTSASNDNNEPEVDFTSIVAEGDFLSAILKEKKLSKAEIAVKYGNKKYPAAILSRKRLNERCEKVLEIVPQILKGKVDTSYIYPMAKEKAVNSKFETMTQAEKFDIEWKTFFGGYYGFQRQTQIASLIMDTFAKELESANIRNKVVSYWTINGFSTFILANEVILRLIMEDFLCDFQEAERIMRESIDYGVEVSDEIDLINDLSIDKTTESQLDFARTREAKEKKEVNRKEKENDNEDELGKKIDNMATIDILDKIMNASSDSDSD